MLSKFTAHYYTESVIHGNIKESQAVFHFPGLINNYKRTTTEVSTSKHKIDTFLKSIFTVYSSIEPSSLMLKDLRRVNMEMVDIGITNRSSVTIQDENPPFRYPTVRSGDEESSKPKASPWIRRQGTNSWSKGGGLR